MNDIKVGDLVYIINFCCPYGERYLGKIGTVIQIFTGENPCSKCGTNHKGVVGAYLDTKFPPDTPGFSLLWLKKIPPLEELDRTMEEKHVQA